MTDPEDTTAKAPIWTLSTDLACTRLDSKPEGLAPQRATERLSEVGENRLPEAKARSALSLFIAQFKSLLILLLLGASVLAVLVGDHTDAVVILVVVLFNAGLGFAQEYRAEAAAAALRGMLAPNARVRRDGDVQVVPAQELVPGDVVLLEAGDRIPADGRFLVAHALEVDESSLTGESVPASKHTRALAEADLEVGDRDNMGFMNTAVTRGRGELLVHATGVQTEMGRLARMLESAEAVQTPLQTQIDGLARRLALLAAVAVAVIAGLQLSRGTPLVDVLMEAVAIAVAAIPEGLPAVVTVTLALGMRRMAQRGAIVKRMTAVEALGSTTDICSDKTGTLTLNQMTVRETHTADGAASVDGEGYGLAGEITGTRGPAFDTLMRGAALCNDSEVREGQVVGDPTEGALWVLAAKAGGDVDALRRDHPRVDELPFESERKFSATLHEDGTLFVKGAPDVVLGRCAQQLQGGQPRALDASDRQRFEDVNNAMSDRGLRVLCIAVRNLEVGGEADGELLDAVESLTFVGLVGILDPPRSAAGEAIAVCRRAGVHVRMITGDHPNTGLSIARALGIPGEALLGRDIERLDDQALSERMPGLGVLARVSPEHKLRAVRALRSRGRVVAMIGDGVNDAPALKQADIGVAMGITGTEVTKEAATLILSDDDFTTVVRAIREGRTIYDNIVRFLRFQLSTNLGALSTLVMAPLLGLPTPFTPVQILWVNLIMDGPPAMALGVDPPGPGVMSRPPRDPAERILNLRRLLVLCLFGAVMTTGTLGVLGWALSARSSAEAMTLAFTTFVLFQVFNVFNVRFEHHSVLGRHSLTNGYLWLAVAAVVVLQVLAVHVPALQVVFETAPLSLADWGVAVGTAAVILVVDELRKLLLRLSGQRTESR